MVAEAIQLLLLKVSVCSVRSESFVRLSAVVRKNIYFPSNGLASGYRYTRVSAAIELLAQQILGNNGQTV